MKYENSWTQPGVLGKTFLNEAISLKWTQTNYDNPQRFETEYKAQKITLEWFYLKFIPDHFILLVVVISHI